MKLALFLAASERTNPAIVLSVSYANALGIIHDLAAFGVPVLGLDGNPRAVGFLSRHAAGMVCPDPLRDEEAFLLFLEDLGARLPRKAVLFPTHDEFVWPLAREAERLSEHFIVPFSRWPVMERLHDKQEQVRAAWRAHVDTPRTMFVDSRDDLAKGAAEIGFPAIFKPTESLAFKRRFRHHVLEITSADELTTVYDEVSDCGTLMLQEVVPGGDDELWTLGSYLDARSRPLALFTGHKLRQHPPRFGYCRMGVSEWNPEVADAGLRLLQELGYHGVSQVEFKRDPRDGRYRLMEINARHWMWHSLAAHSGVNLSLAAYRDAVGRPHIARRQTDGPRWSMAIDDAADALGEIRRGELSVRSWLASYRHVKVDGVLSLDDPLPGLTIFSRKVIRESVRKVIGHLTG